VQIALRVFQQQHVPVEVVVVLIVVMSPVVRDVSTLRVLHGVLRGERGERAFTKPSCWAITKTRRHWAASAAHILPA